MKKDKVKILIGVVSVFIVLVIILLPKIQLYFASESFTINKTDAVFLIDKKHTQELIYHLNPQSEKYF